MSRKISSSTIFFSLSLISLGILLLLNNFGLMSKTDWMLLADMWPLLFILLGTRLIVKNDRLFNTIMLIAFTVIWLFILIQMTNGQDLWEYWGKMRKFKLIL